MRRQVVKSDWKEVGVLTAFVLIVCGLLFSSGLCYMVAAAVLMVVLVLPICLMPLAKSWLFIGEILGRVTSKVVLVAVYAVVLLPVAWIRRLKGKDTLLLNEFKKGQHSVFKIRSHIYSKPDLLKPY